MAHLPRTGATHTHCNSPRGRLSREEVPASTARREAGSCGDRRLGAKAPRRRSFFDNERCPIITARYKSSSSSSHSCGHPPRREEGGSMDRATGSGSRLFARRISRAGVEVETGHAMWTTSVWTEPSQVLSESSRKRRGDIMERGRRRPGQPGRRRPISKEYCLSY